MLNRLLFISDLHLQESRPELTSALLQFLRNNAGKTKALYILGDLFEAWLGDDIETELSETVAGSLRDFANAGAEIYLMHGNRDFLIGHDYAQHCQAKLIDEPYLIDSSAGPLTLLHGDALCTDDSDYQQFRQLVRQPEWQKEFLAKSVADRLAFARQARAQSQAATAEKTTEIMDVNENAVAELAFSEQATTIIHGHTHRPKQHEFPINDSLSGLRMVLGDWDKLVWYIECDETGLALHHYDLNTNL